MLGSSLGDFFWLFRSCSGGCGWNPSLGRLHSQIRYRITENKSCKSIVLPKLRAQNDSMIKRHYFLKTSSASGHFQTVMKWKILVIRL